MIVTVHDVWVLIRLRWKLLVRSGLSRYTRAARLAAPIRFAFLVLIGLWIMAALVLPAQFVLTISLGGDSGRHVATSFLMLATSGISVLIFFYAILALVGTFTYRGDLRLLLMTPVSTRLIFASKILGVSFGSSLLLLVTLPGLIAAGNQLNFGQAFLPASILTIILLPIAPVSIAALFVLFILQFVPAARARAVATFMGTITGAALFVGQQALFGVGRALGPRGAAAPQLPDALPSGWVGHMLASIGLGDASDALVYGVGATGVALGLLAAAVETSAHVLQLGSSSYQEVAHRKRLDARLTKALESSNPLRTSMPRAFGRRPEWWPLFVKEWLLLRRDSQRLAAMSYPLFIIGFYLWQLFSLGNSPLAVTHGLFFGSLYGVLTIAGILLLNSVAPTIVNREGRSIYLLALAPLSAHDVLVSKWAFAATPPLCIVEGLLVAGALILHLGIVQSVIIAGVMAGMVIGLVGMSIAINLIWPKLVFTNPRQQGSRIAALVGMASEFIVGLCVFGLLSFIFVLLPDQPGAALAVLLVLVIGLAAITGFSSVVATRLLAALLRGER